MLDLAPQTETLMQEYAAREGVNVDEAVSQLIRAAITRPAQPGPPSVHHAVNPAVESPLYRLLEAQLREAENATPDAAAEANYQQWQRDMDAPRRDNGERLLFSEI